MRQPATAPGSGRGEKGAPRSESGSAEPAIARFKDRTDLGGKFGILDSVSPVALDEGNDDVLAAQCRQ
jgi:hypothetical protein